MKERVRDAALWVVVAVLAILALLSTRGSSATPPPHAAAHRVAPDAVPAAPVVSATPAATMPAAAAVAPHAADALATVADATATCEARTAAVEQLRAAGDPAAIPALTAAARRGDCVAAAARAAVRALGRRETAAY